MPGFRHCSLIGAAVLLLVVAASSDALADETFSRQVHAMERADDLKLLDGTLEPVGEGPGGKPVLGASGDFAVRIDLAPLKLDPHQFDLLKIEIKADAMLMARRTGVKQTDFIAALSPKVKSVRQIPATRADGKPANATAAEITFENGQTCRAISSDEPEGTEVRAGNLVTRARFETDFATK
jgi:hypothetical protein